MTAQNSTSKTNFGKYFFYKLNSLKLPFIGICFLTMFGLPFYGLISIFYANAAIKCQGMDQNAAGFADARSIFFEIEDMLQFSGTISEIIMILVITLGIVILLKNFRWLYNKKYIDMDMALPVSLSTRFAADFLSGLAVYLVPQIVFGIAAKILLSIAKSKMLAAKVSLTIYGYDVFGVSNLIILGIVASIVFYCICLLVMSVCARDREAKILPIAFNIIVVELCMTLGSLGQYYYGSVQSGFSDAVFESGFFKAVSPISLIIAYGERSIYEGDFFDLNSSIFIIAFCCIYVVAAWLIIKKRRTESIGKPYIHPIVKHIVLSMVSLAFVAGMTTVIVEATAHGNYADVISLLIFGFVGSLAIFIIIDLMSGQHIKNIVNTILRYIITVLVCVGLCYLLVQYSGKGKENYIPEISEIEAANVHIYNGDVYSDNLIADDGGNIRHFDKLIQLHSEILDLHKEDRKGNCIIRIEYTLKNGDVVARAYNDVPFDYITRALELIIEGGVHELMDYDVLQGIYQWGDCIGKNIMLDMSGVEGSHVNLMTGEEVKVNKSQSNEVYGYIRTDIPGEELYEALKKDYASIDFNKLYCSPYRTIANIKIEYVLKDGPIKFAADDRYPFYNYPVYSFCENALAVLEKYQQEHSDIVIDTFALADEVVLTRIKGGCRTYVIPNLGYTSYVKNNIVQEISFYEDVVSEYIDVHSEEVKELLNYCTPFTYVKGYEGQDLYQIEIRRTGAYENNYSLVVRPEYNDRVAEIFEKYLAE